MTTAKKKRKKTPNAHACDYLRSLGFEAAVVEQTIPKTFIKRDLFGIIDIIAVNGKNCIGIQVTSGGGIGDSNFNARRVKILAEPRALLWVKSGNLLELWNWLPETQTFRREEIVESDFDSARLGE